MNRETKIIAIVTSTTFLAGIIMIYAANKEEERRKNYHKERVTLCWNMLKLSERQNEAIIDLLIEIRDALNRDKKTELRRSR